jgi:SP family general alpha glucoside:H+ symporter-like MFS transporter
LAHSTAANYATGSLLLVFTPFYKITIDSVCYSIVAEIPSSRLRTKPIVLARIAYNIQGTINNVITLDMINPTYWNWKSKACIFCAGLCFICLVWRYFRYLSLRDEHTQNWISCSNRKCRHGNSALHG